MDERQHTRTEVQVQVAPGTVSIELAANMAWMMLLVGLAIGLWLGTLTARWRDR